MEILVTYKSDLDYLTNGEEVKQIVVKSDTIKCDPETNILYLGDFDLIFSRFVKAEIISL